MKKKASPPTGKTVKRRMRVTFPRISDEMKEWSAMLGAELQSWPQISTKKMFGFLSFYRGGAIFAALPQTRGFDSPSSMILKFNAMAPKLLKRAEADGRMDTSTRVPGRGWFSFELRSENDLRDALWWLESSV
jgi:hypothetical protein